MPRQLSLGEALTLARQNSPSYRQVLNDADPASAAVRAAYGALFPTLNSSSGVSYSRAGRQTFANQVFSQGSPTVSSNYNLSASWSISKRELLLPGQQKAQQRVVEENITGAGVSLTADVTTQYLAALRAEAQVEVAQQQLTRNDEFLALARARQNVGQANLLDVRQAEVTRGQSEVALLRARQSSVEAKIELLRRLGMAPSEGIDSMRLTESFQLAEPTYNLDALLQVAGTENPTLRAADAQQESARYGVRSAKAAYLPSFSISTGLAGFTQQFTDINPQLANALGGAQGNAANCTFQNGILSRLTSPHPSPNGGIIPDCNAFAGLDASGTALQSEVEQRIRDGNSGWPFSYTRQPWSISASVSLPLWDGFARAQSVSQARAAEDDAREAVRARRLEVSGTIQARLGGVRTAFEAARIQDVNRTLAREQFQLAQDRYRIGQGNALELADAQNAVTRAEADYVTAVYDYHQAVVALEAAVGRPLR
jgi:outer membrane protein